MNSYNKCVVTKTKKHSEMNNSRLVKGNAEEEVAKLKGQPGKDLFIFGSANLSASLTRRGLIDEYRLCMAPLVLGGGNPLFKESPERLKLKPAETKPSTSGGVILYYQREKATTP